MIARKFFVRPRVHPNRAIAPRARLIDSDQFRSWNRRLPGNLVVKINSLADRRESSEREQEQRLSDCSQLVYRCCAPVADGVAAGVPAGLFAELMPAAGDLNSGGAPGGLFICAFT